MGYVSGQGRRNQERDQERLIQGARSRYVTEEITLDEFEKQVERILHGRRAPIKPKYPASPKHSQ